MTKKEIKGKTVSQAQLLRMGWTKQMIEKFLPEPILAPNPMKFKQPMKLYKLSDIEIITQTEGFKNEVTKRKKGIRTISEREELQIDYFNKIIVKKISRELLLEEALKLNKKLYDPKDYNFGDETKNLDNETFERYQVHYIRHNLSNYDLLLIEIKGKRGARILRKELKKAVIEKIGIIYPYLSSEVKRQLNQIGGRNDENIKREV